MANPTLHPPPPSTPQFTNLQRKQIRRYQLLHLELLHHSSVGEPPWPELLCHSGPVLLPLYISKTIRTLVREGVEVKEERLVVMTNRTLRDAEWAHTHPGGSLPLFTLAGQDATDAFLAYHPSTAFLRLFSLSTGLLLHDYSVCPLCHDYRRQAPDLMTDLFGDYVIHKFFKHGLPPQSRELAGKLFGHVLTFSLQMYGCRVI